MDEATRIGVEMAESLERFVNNFSREPQKACIQQLMRCHNTLQQSLARMFLAYFEELSKKEYKDLRNEASVELGKAIMALPDRVRILPFI